ncbi:MAG: prolyl oligopeptidase family serine peptidase [Rhodospirillales bacterium]|nr:prolyl oligopeptidase family serine peptidase [Rhodospirillales bacterium]
MALSFARIALCTASLFAGYTGFGAFSPTAQSAEPNGPTSIPVSSQSVFEHIVHSDILGRDMQLLVWKPEQAAPESGYPVIYSFDGETSIPIFAEFAAQAARVGARYKLVAPLIVGFAEMPDYWSGPNAMDQRTFDFTPPADQYDVPERPNLKPWPKLGGGDAYLQAVIAEFKPMIAEIYAVDQTRETLFGHSLGGMMVLHALATHPDAFDAYVAASPSIWFNKPERMAEMRDFLARSDFSQTAPIPLMLSVGGEEAKLDDWEMLMPPDARERRKAWKHSNDMVNNAREMASMITEKGMSRIDLSFAIFDGEDHHTAKPITINRAIRFAMTPR